MNKMWFLFLSCIVVICLCIGLTGCKTWFMDDAERNQFEVQKLSENLLKMQKELADKQQKIGVLNTTSQQILQSQAAIKEQNQKLQDELKEQQHQQLVAKTIDKYESWVYMFILALVSILGSWYFKATGKQSETLGKISESLNNSLSFKQKTIYRVLRWLYRRYVAKKKAEKEKKL